RSDLRWKPKGRIFKFVGLRRIPTGKLFDSCISKVDSEPPHGSNVVIPNIYKCKQTMDISTGTPIHVQKKQSQQEKSQSMVAEKADISETIVKVDSQMMIQKNDSSAVTTADASGKRQQQPDSTSPTSTLATTVTADGNFNSLF
ncbi:hypothetical protein Tco_0188418, partial [Tanacetum coccineum]